MSYNTFAKFYDTLTENVEYKKRADYISSFFKRYADKCDTVLDLACGTGSVSKYLIWDITLLGLICLTKCLLWQVQSK